jgi:N utilization substance protein B
MAVPAQKFREIVFQMLYSYDLGQSTDESMVELLSKELKVSNKNVREAQSRVHEIRAQLKQIDPMIAKTSHAYEFERIQTVERNILRLALFEMFFDKGAVPPKVVMAEAMRLARKFSTPASTAFINAILDTLYKASLGEKVDTTQLVEASENLSLSEQISRDAALKEKKPPESDDEEE